MMKKILFTFLLGCALFSLNCQAEEFENWNGIDKVCIEQKVDVNTCKVYVYGHSTAEMKNDKKVEKQQAAFKELPETLADALKEAFPKATIVTVNNIEEAPADGLLIDACLTEINWGSGALRQWVGFGAGNIHAYYEVEVTNAEGVVCKLENHRFHDTTFNSAKGAPVIKAFNKAIAKDVIALLKEVK